jgi:pimeloyl-ACP methyl ester carboxylesterase
MEHSSCGASNARLVVYFHGAPGGMGEVQILHAGAQQHGLTVICQDRFSIDASIVGERYFQLLADDIARLAQGEQVDLIGFSIGAFVALQVSRLMGRQVRSLHLISPAAPLEGGDFLKSMAGRQVFWLAMHLPQAFKLLSYWQGLLAALFPRLLYGMLFASATAGDKELVADGDFKQSMRGILRACFRDNIAGYVREVQAYVAPWHTTLKDVPIMTQLWQGDQDNWSPKAMAAYVQQQLPNCLAVHHMQGLSHYSTLYAAAPLICEQLDPLASPQTMGRMTGNAEVVGSK